MQSTTEAFIPQRFDDCTLMVLGSGVGIPQANRNASGLLLSEKNRKLCFLIDCGSGIPRQVIRSGTHYTQISHLFLSHLHVDHASGVPSLLQALTLDSSSRHLQIFGPPGTSSFCDTIIKILFPSLEEYVSIEVTEVEEGRVVTGPDWQVNCTMVQHFRVEALAYRFEINNKNFVYSGDTAPCESLKRLASETNLLVHECSFLDNAPEDQLKGHSTPSQVAEIARMCNVKKLCLTHFYPETAKRISEILQLVRNTFNGEILIAHDLLQLNL